MDNSNLGLSSPRLNIIRNMGDMETITTLEYNIMANINQAMQWLKVGKRVKKTNWMKESYWYMAEDHTIMYADQTKAVIYPNQILSNDWQIWKPQPKVLVDKTKVYEAIEKITLRVFNAPWISSKFDICQCCEMETKDEIDKIRVYVG